MGQKTAIIVVGLALLSAALQVAAMMLPMHTVAYSTAAILPLVSMTTYLIGARARPGALFCKFVGVFSTTICNGLSELKDLQDLSQRFCSAGITSAFPGTCEVLTRSYFVGHGVVCAFAIDFALMLIACYFVLDYSLRKHRERYRQLGLIFMGMAIAVEVSALIAYGVGVIRSLESLGPPPAHMGGSLLVSPSAGGHTGMGYFVAWVSVLPQFTAMALFGLLKFSDELDEETRQEIKAQEAFEAGLMGKAVQGPGEPGFYPSPGYDAGLAPQHAQVYSPGYGSMGAADPMGGAYAAGPAPLPPGVPLPPAGGMVMSPAPMQPAW